MSTQNSRRKLVAIVAKRFDLDDDERNELEGRTLGEMAAHAEHLVARRRHVERHMEKHPTGSESSAASAFDARQRPEPRGAGRRLLSNAMSDRLSNDPEVRHLFGRIGSNTLNSRRAPTESDDARRRRIADRLAEAGFGHQSNADYGFDDDGRRI